MFGRDFSQLNEIARQANHSGIAINEATLRDNERCRDQQRECAQGYVDVTVDTNRYGWAVRPLSNLVNGGSWLSEAYSTREEAVAWARLYVSGDPAKRRLLVIAGREWIEE